MRYVADFSDWQVGIDMPEVARKFDGIIVKALEGQTIQDCWRDYISQAQWLNMPWGIYAYTRATDPDAARAEARLVISMLRNREIPALGIWYDIEAPGIVGSNGSMPYSASHITALASAFISECNASGYQAGIYAPQWVLRDRLHPWELADYVPYWISAPGEASCPQIDGITNIAGWQYRVEDYPIGNQMVDASEWYV